MHLMEPVNVLYLYFMGPIKVYCIPHLCTLWIHQCIISQGGYSNNVFVIVSVDIFFRLFTISTMLGLLNEF